MVLSDLNLNLYLHDLCNDSTENSTLSSENCILDEDAVESVTEVLDDNTYRHSLNFSGEGLIRVDASLLTQNKVYCEFYNTINFEGSSVPYLWDSLNIDLNETEPILNYTHDGITISLTENYSARYNATLDSPVSGNYTFTLGWDDSWKVFLNDSLVLNMTSEIERDAIEQSFEVEMTANHSHSLSIELVKYTNKSKLQFWWKRPDQSTKEIVPIEYLEYQAFLGTDNTLVINITCPLGYTTDDDNRINVWDIRWGDGYRFNYEEWDDGNHENSDGWNINCRIEENYIWSGGSFDTTDKCTKCPSGYSSDKEFERSAHDHCQPTSLSKSNTIIYICTVIVLVIGMLVYFRSEFIRVYSKYQNDEHNHIELHR